MKNLVFDLDGTLVDSVVICTQIVNDMLEVRGLKSFVTIDQARRYMSTGGQILVSTLLGSSSQDSLSDLEEFRERYASQPTPEDSLYPFVRKTLETLKLRGATLSICSNKPQALCEKVLSDFSLEHLFSAIVGTLPGLPHKPDPAHLDRTLEIIGATSRVDCVYIGDSEVDFELSLQAGVPFVGVSYGYGPWDRFSLSEVEMKIDRFDKLLDIDF